MHHILFYDVVEDFVSKRTEFRSLHLEHVRRAHERGDIVLAGALAEPTDGAVLVFRGASAETAEDFAREGSVRHERTCEIVASPKMDDGGWRRRVRPRLAQMRTPNDAGEQAGLSP